MDTSDWIAIAAVAVALLAAGFAGGSWWQAKRSAGIADEAKESAARSATAAERSADSAERSEAIATEAKDATVRQAAVAEEQLALASATAVDWKVLQNDVECHFINEGNESAHNVEVVGNAIVSGAGEHGRIGKGERVRIVYTRAGRKPTVVITWNRPHQLEAEPEEFQHQLWAGEGPRPQARFA